ncbi:zeta toxin family protein [Agrobacterium tumefaciens]|uniref:zeta toxin family protein n=1 Tax=Agrobacterium tumefaciens TaxID=358 RepID=UPI0015719513|nr:hypothetical protein [Agrobacterium tumefaciens]
MVGPYCTVFAGPNGSGKSSIYDKIRPPGEFVNADLIEASLQLDVEPAARKVRAGRIAITRINELMTLKTDFAFETTLSSHHSLSVLAKAKTAGYRIGMVFVGLDSAERNVERVQYRVKLGGHDIPREDVVRRYDIAFNNLEKALRIVDDAVIFDNSDKEPQILCEIADGKVAMLGYFGGIPMHKRIADIVNRTFSGHVKVLGQ